jgi:hypothetical protein
MTDPTTLPSELHPTIALLPWYLSGTLTAEEQTAVSAHLQGCPSCRQELEDLDQLRTRIRQAADAGPLPSADLAQAVLARVRHDALRQSNRRTALLPVQAASDGFLAGADRWLRSVLTPQWVPTLVSAVLIAQLGLLSWSLLRYPAPDTTTSDNVSSRGLDRTSVRLEIEFQPGTTMEQAQTLLRSVQGRVTAGPTAAGAFVIELPASGAASVQERADALRNRRDIIRSVAVAEP